LLIERLSGENYYDYVRRHILEPAGMTRTASWFVDSLPPNTAIGYTKGGERAAEGGEGTALARNTELLPGDRGRRSRAQCRHGRRPGGRRRI